MTKAFLRNTLLAAATLVIAPSTWAAFVTWQLNPNSLNQSVGSNTNSYTVSGATITARGFDNNGGNGVAHTLFYKYENPIGGAVERGLGLTGIPDSELFSNQNGTPANFIQLDLRSILTSGFTGGQIEVGSVQSGETFRLFGSNSQGLLGTQIGTSFGSVFDNTFVSIANFGSYKFISVAAGTGDVLPIAFRAQAVPEVSAFLPALGLVVAVSATRILRNRRAARASSLC